MAQPIQGIYSVHCTNYPYTRKQKQKRALASPSRRQLTDSFKQELGSSGFIVARHQEAIHPISICTLPLQHSFRSLARPAPSSIREREKKFKIHTGVVWDLQRSHDVSQQTRRNPRFLKLHHPCLSSCTRHFVYPTSDGPLQQQQTDKKSQECISKSLCGSLRSFPL